MFRLSLAIIFCPLFFECSTKITEATGDSVLGLFILVDDYEGTSTNNQEWFYSRIGTDKGTMGSGDYSASLGNGEAVIQVDQGWAGVWTSLKGTAKEDLQLKSDKLLGPYIKEEFQAKLTGIKIKVKSGSGILKVELRGADNSILFEGEKKIEGKGEIAFTVNTSSNIKFFNWLLDGPGNITVDAIFLEYEQNQELNLLEKAFLFSYGHFSDSYDKTTGLTRDRARWPVNDFASVQTIGCFALATAVGMDLGFIDGEVARGIILNTKNALLAIPTNKHGLLPHFVTNGNLTPGTEWSSIDGALALVSQILALESIGESTLEVENKLKAFDWEDLTDGGLMDVSHGYTETGTKIESRWDVFGSEKFIIELAYSSATLDSNLTFSHPVPPTWDGAGFNDAMTSLFFPMHLDKWGHHWIRYIDSMATIQISYSDKSLFGFSPSEVPEPWQVSPDQVYSAWGVGGHNEHLNDGSEVAGYPFFAPHYAALIAREFKNQAEKMFSYMMEEIGIFTPLNNVESIGFDSNELKWNSLKGSWNLSLQTLGLARALSDEYLPYTALEKNEFLLRGYNNLMP